MNPTGILLIAILVFSNAAAEEEVRQTSLGPLVRFDPNARQLKNLLAVHGDPGLGLTGAHSGVSDRIGNTGKWIAGLAGGGGMPTNVALMEFVGYPGEFRHREILRLNAACDASADERAVFGCRRGTNMEDVWECFSLVDNHSLWTAEKDVFVMDAMFSPDGGHVIVLHGLGRRSSSLPSAVSWYETATGRRVRRVALPGDANPLVSCWNRNLLAWSQGSLFVARPSGDSGDFFMIPKDATEATLLEFDGAEWGDCPKVRAGGSHGELLAFYDDGEIRVRRFEDMRMTDLGRIDVHPPDDGNSYTGNVRFSPDGKWIIASRCGRTRVMPVNRDGIGAAAKDLAEGSSSGDFTADGKFYICIDDGGGRIPSANLWWWTGGRSKSFGERKWHGSLAPPLCPQTRNAW